MVCYLAPPTCLFYHLLAFSCPLLSAIFPLLPILVYLCFFLLQPFICPFKSFLCPLLSVLYLLILYLSSEDCFFYHLLSFLFPFLAASKLCYLSSATVFYLLPLLSWLSSIFCYLSSAHFFLIPCLYSVLSGMPYILFYLSSATCFFYHLLRFLCPFLLVFSLFLHIIWSLLPVICPISLLIAVYVILSA
jgi:hypothetical protein